MHGTKAHFLSGRNTSSDKASKFIDEIIGNAGTESDHQVMASLMKMYGGGGQGEPVGTDGLGFAHGGGKGKQAPRAQLMKWPVLCQQGLNGRIVVNDRSQDRPAGWMMRQNLPYRLRTSVRDIQYFLKDSVPEDSAFRAGIPKIKTEGSIQWPNIRLIYGFGYIRGY